MQTYESHNHGNPERSMAGGVIAAVAAACLLLVAPVAQAQIGYSGIVADLSRPGQDANDLTLEQDALGNVFAVWTTGTDVWAARRAAGTRVWGETVALRRPGGPDGGPQSPAIAVDDRGNAVVVWYRMVGAGIEEWILEFAQFGAETAAWTSTAAVPGAVGALYPEVVYDSRSRFTVSWHQLVSDFEFRLKAARYSPSPAGWGPIREVGVTLNVATGSQRKLVIDREDFITAIWTYANNSAMPPEWAIRAARYNSSTDTWGSPATLATGTGNSGSGKLAIDESGDVLAVWEQPEANTGRLFFAHFDNAAGAWSSARPIPGTLDVGDEQFAALPGGDFLAIWTASDGDLNVVQASRLRGADSWTAPVNLSALSDDADAGDLETDGLGNAFATWSWQIDDEGNLLAQAARYNPATDSWTAPVTLGDLGEDGEDVQVAVNAAGNAIIGWEYEGDGDKVQMTEWLAEPAAPAITGIVPGNGTLAVSFTPPVTTDAAFAPTHYEYRLENVTGLGWIGGSPPFTSSPLTIVSLANGQAYGVRVRAWNRGGAGLPSAPVNGTPGTAVLLAPIGFRVGSIVGNTVTLTWGVAAGSVAPTGFVLEGGIAPGQILASIPTGSTATSLTVTAPTGAFYVRMHALAGATRSGASNEIRIFVNVPPPPDPPRNLAGTAQASALSLAWQNSAGAGVYQAVVLSVTGSVSTSITLPGSTESFTYAGVPAGTYTFTVRAANRRSQ